MPITSIQQRISTIVIQLECNSFIGQEKRKELLREIEYLADIKTKLEAAYDCSISNDCIPLPTGSTGDG